MNRLACPARGPGSAQIEFVDDAPVLWEQRSVVKEFIHIYILDN